MWRNRLKQSLIAMGEDYPKHIQDIRKKVLVPALKNIKNNQPRTNASVIGNRLIVNGKKGTFTMTFRRNGFQLRLLKVPRVLAISYGKMTDAMERIAKISRYEPMTLEHFFLSLALASMTNNY